MMDGHVPSFNKQWYETLISNSNEKEMIISNVEELLGDNIDSCLEIGMGTRPIFAERLAKKCGKYVILEKNDFADPLPHKATVIKEDWESVQLKEKFDFILASHVIYYLKNKKKAIEKMISCLKPNGKIIFIVNGKDVDYGSTKKFFSARIGKKYEFTYDKLLALLKNQSLVEHTVSCKVRFRNLDELHHSLKLAFDNHPKEYENLRKELIAYWKNSLNNGFFVINQKIIEVTNTLPKEDYIQSSKKVLLESQKEEGRYFTEILGRKFIVHKNVFSPKYFSDTKKFCEVLPIEKDQTFLDIGCGTGVVSVFAALRGAKTIYSTDINPDAINNTLENAALHGFSDKITAIVGNVYGSIPKDIKFDSIFWNGPFLYTEESNLDILERSILDTNYDSLLTTIREAVNYLAPSGKLYLGFSTTVGNFGLLKKFLKESGFSFKIIFQMNAPLGNPEGVKEKYDNISFEIIEAVRS